jgi:hypothetical protein
MKYNNPTLRTILSTISALVIMLVAGALGVLMHSDPRALVSPSNDVVALLAAPGTTGETIMTIKPFPQGKLDERFFVAWPPSLKVAVPETVVVRIAAKAYGNITAGIVATDRLIKQETFKGEPRLEVTLTADSGLETIKQHSDIQVVKRDERYREWSWTVIPKMTGIHRLSLLVRGIHGDRRDDYDPEVMQYDVAFNLWYWLSGGIQENGVSWAWAFVLVVLASLVTHWIDRFLPKRKRTKHR